MSLHGFVARPRVLRWSVRPLQGRAPYHGRVVQTLVVSAFDRKGDSSPLTRTRSTRETTRASGAATKLERAPILVWASAGPSGKAAVAKNNETVKPIAAATPTTRRSLCRRPCGRRAPGDLLVTRQVEVRPRNCGEGARQQQQRVGEDKRGEARGSGYRGVLRHRSAQCDDGSRTLSSTDG
jgi:hypothetical protein